MKSELLECECERGCRWLSCKSLSCTARQHSTCCKLDADATPAAIAPPVPAIPPLSPEIARDKRSQDQARPECATVRLWTRYNVCQGDTNLSLPIGSADAVPRRRTVAYLLSCSRVGYQYQRATGWPRTRGVTADHSHMRTAHATRIWRSLIGSSRSGAARSGSMTRTRGQSALTQNKKPNGERPPPAARRWPSEAAARGPPSSARGLLAGGRGHAVG